MFYVPCPARGAPESFGVSLEVSEMSEKLFEMPLEVSRFSLKLFGMSGGVTCFAKKQPIPLDNYFRYSYYL
jgi:hypothetical protein